MADLNRDRLQAVGPGGAKPVAAPARPGQGKPAEKLEELEARRQAESATPELKENREANAAPEPLAGPAPEPVMDERENRREGPEANLENKAFPNLETGTQDAPLEKSRKDRRVQTRPVSRHRNEHAALQEDQQEIINREQARMPTTDTPAGDSSPAPEANESANWVDKPARAHTLSERDDENTADSVGQRLRRAVESARLEERPDRRGIHSDAIPGAYTVEEELRSQWPGIRLGDDEE